MAIDPDENMAAANTEGQPAIKWLAIIMLTVFVVSIWGPLLGEDLTWAWSALYDGLNATIAFIVDTEVSLLAFLFYVWLAYKLGRMKTERQK